MSDLTQPLYLGEICEPGGGRKGPIRTHRRPPSGVASKAILAFALVAALVGVAVVGWAIYEPYSHQGATQQAQSDLQQQWDEPPVIPTPGASNPPHKKDPPAGPTYKAYAKLQIPALGLTWYIIDGISEADLRYAPGHYPQTAKPGATGNFAVAGHREKGMFYDLDEVRVGSQIILETHTKRYVYTVRSNTVTKPTAIPSYISATPPGIKPGSKALTLTTCNPKWDNYERLIVVAVLTSSTSLGG